MTRTRRPVVLRLLLGLVALGAPLYAWLGSQPSQSSFSDVEEVGENRLGTGRLDVTAGSASVTFDADNVAPGDRLDATLVVENHGTLPLRFSLAGSVAGADLAPWMSWWVSGDARAGCESAVPSSTPVVIDSGATVELAGLGQLASLGPGDARTLCLGARASIDTPNSAQSSRMEIRVEVHAEHDLTAEGP